MANKKAPKKTFSSSCFDAAMKLRGTSIRKLGAIEGGVGWSAISGSKQTVLRSKTDAMRSERTNLDY